jgi:hypothetical protein
MAHPKTLAFIDIDFAKMRDNIDFVNVYSQSLSPLGRILTNWANTSFTFRGKVYMNVEAYWATKVTGQDCSKMAGMEAKKFMQSNPRRFPPPTYEELYEVYLAKLQKNDRIKSMLLSNRLPFAHFYVMFGKKISADEHLWTADLWRRITDELRDGKI